jgi:hypothetical protein
MTTFVATSLLVCALRLQRERLGDVETPAPPGRQDTLPATDGDGSSPRPHCAYGLSDAQIAAALSSGSQVHGVVEKQGSLPPAFWQASERPRFERELDAMVVRGE